MLFSISGHAEAGGLSATQHYWLKLRTPGRVMLCCCQPKTQYSSSRQSFIQKGSGEPLMTALQLGIASTDDRNSQSRGFMNSQLAVRSLLRAYSAIYNLLSTRYDSANSRTSQIHTTHIQSTGSIQFFGSPQCRLRASNITLNCTSWLRHIAIRSGVSGTVLP